MGSTIIMLVKVQIPSLVNTMLSSIEGIECDQEKCCSCSYPMWKPSSCAMVVKVSQTALGVLMFSLLGAQHKKWISIGSI